MSAENRLSSGFAQIGIGKDSDQILIDGLANANIAEEIRASRMLARGREPLFTVALFELYSLTWFLARRTRSRASTAFSR